MQELLNSVFSFVFSSTKRNFHLIYDGFPHSDFTPPPNTCLHTHIHERWGARRKEIAARQCDPGRQVFAAGHLQIAFQFQSATFDTHTGLISSSLVSRTALSAYFLPHWSRDFKSIISSGFKKKRKSQIVMRDMCSLPTFLGARSDMRTFYTWCAREGKIYKYLSYEHTHGRRARSIFVHRYIYSWDSMKW